MGNLHKPYDIIINGYIVNGVCSVRGMRIADMSSGLNLDVNVEQAGYAVDFSELDATIFTLNSLNSIICYSYVYSNHK